MAVLTRFRANDRSDVNRPAPAGLEPPSADLGLTQRDTVDLPMRELAHSLGLTEALALKPRHEQEAI